MDFVIGGLAACGACVFRGQHAIFYKNVFHAGWVVAKNEGLRGLQKGLGPALLMHTMRNSAVTSGYTKKGYLTDEKGKTILYRSALAGAATGCAGAFLGSPLFLIKTQLQSQAAKEIAVGTQHGHSGAFQAFRGIYSQYGIFGLWRGVSGTLVRAIVGSSAQLTTFALTKDILNNYEVFRSHPVANSLVSSVVGGVFQTVMMTPFDLVSTRLYNQGVDASGKGVLYRGLTDCFIKIWRSEGFFGFYKGIGANYMRLAPHGALCLVFWDVLKDVQVKYIDTRENRY
ncbi:hypothetical protein NQ315_005168 [Exocentrus adspersus]|uniref:Solute carrier family 25 member 35 n=1 Tax=Exocentrus adspersus TaxID=1586481 RepID=A0AAV8VU79_9CUCU|nr:hypothetical protein NQ315_005168 [Exocentrus adspersus]